MGVDFLKIINRYIRWDKIARIRHSALASKALLCLRESRIAKGLGFGVGVPEGSGVRVWGKGFDCSWRWILVKVQHVSHVNIVLPGAFHNTFAEMNRDEISCCLFIS